MDYVSGEFEGVVNESRDDGCFPHILIANQCHFELAELWHLNYIKHQINPIYINFRIMEYILFKSM